MGASLPVVRVPCSGKVVGQREKELMHEAVDDGWLTAGRWNADFEEGLAKATGAAWAATVNSGSSANLVAISALGLQPGDEVITVAAGFPTTVNPILLAGATPVFVDVDIPTYNVDVAALEAAVTPKTRAIVLAHTLGNPFDVDLVREICRRHRLRLIEDCCDALGATYAGIGVGTFGDYGTLSFYPAHQITTGEGGAVFSRIHDRVAAESIRDWGRDCYCAPGASNTCGERFTQKHGDLPYGYDHKFVYSRLGYNLKMTDMQAACGVAQLESLPGFVAKRRENWSYLRKRLETCAEFLILPEATPYSEPSWFGFAMTMTDACDFARHNLTSYLAQEGVDSRNLFGGNLTRQPYMQGRNFRISGELKNTDIITERTFWIGCWPGLGEEQLEYAADRIETFLGVSD